MMITQDLSEPFWENSSSRLRALCGRIWTGAMFLGALLTLATGDLSAQQTAVCSDTPGEGNFYLVGSGSVTDYDIDFTSDMRGLLRAGVGGSGYSLGAEAGQRFEPGGKTSLTPRAWLVCPSISVDNFTDAVDSRVSYPDAVRLYGGPGGGGGNRTPLGCRGVPAPGLG